MARVILLALLVTLAATALIPSAEAQPEPNVCTIWPGAPMVCWNYENGCPPPPMYCYPP